MTASLLGQLAEEASMLRHGLKNVLAIYKPQPSQDVLGKNRLMLNPIIPSKLLPFPPPIKPPPSVVVVFYSEQALLKEDIT